MKTKKQNVVVGRVRSDSNPRKAYSIRRVGRGLVCPCLSFRFAHGPIGSRTKICKHIKRLRVAA